MKVGDWVKIVKRSTNFNPHINNLGCKGIVVEVGAGGVQIETTDGGMGAVDIDCVEPYEPNHEDRASFVGWHGMGPEGTARIADDTYREDRSY